MRFRNINIRNIMNEAINNEGIIVDVREMEEFAKGHIPMAINLPLSDIENGKVGLPKNKIILVYCENGGASMMAARILSGNGYNVINTIGGLNNYRGALTRKR
ncbi:MAG: rhodanese-like domain-containing protein [Lachnospiraceae bacterium]|nr:rhodanese-like domain-containing protein [Lachnospiraceae bacterium]MBQ9234721.1 rhodanese-like domain-containing protein [Lachnospiraceae bacterium]